MRRTLLAPGIASSLAFIEKSKPIAIQVGAVVGLSAYSKTINLLLNEYMTECRGPLGDAARANLKPQDKMDSKANHSARLKIWNASNRETSFKTTLKNTSRTYTRKYAPPKTAH